mgnify:FL=1
MAEVFSKPLIRTEGKQESRTPAKDSGSVPIETGKLEVDKDIPVSLYSQRFHKPYASEFFGLDKNFLMNLDRETGKKLGEIDEFILGQIGKTGLADSKKSYNKIMNNLLNILGIDEDERTPAKIDKLMTVISLRKLLK